MNQNQKAIDLTAQMTAKADRANKFLERHNFRVEQVAGQRISTPIQLPANKKAPSKAGLEVFVGKIPRDLFEDELLPLMQFAGPVYKMRLMMDFSGFNRGFAYVLYDSVEAAHRAIKFLNGIEIRPGEKPIGVVISFDNRHLYFGNLPFMITEEKLLKELRNACNGVKSVRMPEVQPNSDRRHAIFEFETHQMATQARRLLVPGRVKIFNRLVNIDWAKPELPENIAALTKKTNTQNQLPSTNYCIPAACVTPPSSVTPPTCEILGESVKQILKTIDDFEFEPQYHHITISNVDLAKISTGQLRRIFELAGRLKLISLKVINSNSITVVYESKEHANLMLEALVLMPECFSRLAQPYTMLTAQPEWVF